MVSQLSSLGCVLYYQMLNVLRRTNGNLERLSPLALISVAATTLIAIKIFSRYATPRKGESYPSMIGRWALNINSVRKMYEKTIQKELGGMAEKTRKQWEKFGPPITQIPEEGLSDQQLHELVEKYTAITEKGLIGKQFSGTIYSKSLDKESDAHFVITDTKSSKIESQEDYLNHLSYRVKKMCLYAFERSYLWNTLHSDEFGVGSFIEYQVVQMVGNLFGAIPNEIMGFVTTGGTESIMNAARIYRNWGRENRGHAPGESVIIAGKSIHASLMKAAEDYDITLVLIDTDDTGKIDSKKLEAAVKKYGNRVVALFGSAPSYPKGKVDDIMGMAQLAEKNGFGMHVDCCLGGFIINFQDDQRSDFLATPGVTTASFDTHKNGWGPKGTSVLITKSLAKGPNVAHYSIYAIPGWQGGVYGTPKLQGSQPVAPAFGAFVTMLCIGKKGYRIIGKSVHRRTCELAEIIDQCPGLKRIGEPEVNVVAFRIDPALKLEHGATYAFAHEMKERGFVLNTISGDAVHFCVTGRFTGDQTALERFGKAAFESQEAVKKLNEDLKKSGSKFPGDAGMYCSLDAAMNPVASKQSFAKYIENVFFGVRGAEAAVRGYFSAHLNPYASQPVGVVAREKMDEKKA